MQLVQSKRIIYSNPWEPELFGHFVESNDCVSFCFLQSSVLGIFNESMDAFEIRQEIPNQYRLGLPDHCWLPIKTSTGSFLLFGEDLCFDFQQNAFRTPLSPELTSEYHRRIPKAKHLEEDSFHFGDYSIHHKGYTGYSCTKNGQHIWDFQGRAYLYTEIECWEDKVFFGTAGKGGYFYILELETGRPVFQMKTGGTVCVVRIENCCYFLQFDNKTYIHCVDMQNGEIIDSVELPGKSTFHSRLQIIDDRLHAITFRYDRQKLSHAIWNIVQL